MRYSALALGLATIAGCAKTEKPAAMPAAPPPAPAAPAMPAPINMADVAGKWTVKSMAADKDTVLVTYTLMATTDANGWMIELPKRKPMPVRVTISGDSVITDTGPYESVLRKGVQVTTHGSFHLMNGKLVGMNSAHYNVKTADSVLMLRSEGMKTP